MKDMDKDMEIDTGWVYIIDPKERTLQHKKIPLDFDVMKEIMGCRLGEIVQLGHGNVMVCDEEARLLPKESRSHFQWLFRRNQDGTMSPNRYLEAEKRELEEIIFCNTCIFISTYPDNEGSYDWASAQMHLWQISQCLEWLHESYHDEPSFEIHMFDDEITRH